MTKGALENLVRCLALENAASGVTINNIAPGLVETDRNAFRRKDIDGWNRLARAANPMRRAGQPADIVGAALFLASDSAAFVTGATIQVTGGAHIPRGANEIIRTWTAAPEAADPRLMNETGSNGSLREQSHDEPPYDRSSDHRRARGWRKPCRPARRHRCPATGP